MAVEATHLNLYPSQLIQDRNLVVNPINQGKDDILYNNVQQMRYSGISNMGLPLNYGSVSYQTAVCNSLQPKTSLNTDISGLTYNIPAANSRKRSRDFQSINQMYAAQNNNNYISPQKSMNSVSQLPSFVGEDFLPQIQQHQLEIEAIISQHTKKIRLEVEEKQKQQTRLVSAAIEEGVMKKLKEKEEQIQRMSKMNMVLRERVKSLFVENQLWREVAQSNEATANSLRTKLEQVLAHGEERISPVEEEAESCSDHWWELAKEKEVEDNNKVGCKNCGERESSVLILPCRHLCLCKVCGSEQLQACPVCSCGMNATLHLNMSSSGWNSQS